MSLLPEPLPVELKDPLDWPQAAGHELSLVAIPDPKGKFALVKCHTSGLHKLLLRSAIRVKPKEPDPKPLNPPLLRWGAVVTLTNGQVVLCVSDDLDGFNRWKGIPTGNRRASTYNCTDIADIQHIHPITKAA